MTGSGNDFVVLDGRTTTIDRWPAAQVRAICHRRRGVGADGLVVLTPSSPEVVRMTYWNSDGSRGAMCGNAALCCARLAVHLEMVPAGEFCILTDAGPVRVQASTASGAMEINLPDFEVPAEFRALLPDKGERWMTLLSVGVPHLVVRVDDVEAVDPGTRGRALRFDPSLGVEGANVNFVSQAKQQGSPWLIRTYERGVESETLACGTGTVAAALALASRGEAQLPLTLRSRGGSDLTVRARLQAHRATEVWLAGEGRLVFRGDLEGV